MENCINIKTADSHHKWSSLCVGIDGSFLASLLCDKELVQPFGGVCVLIKITPQKHKQSEKKSDLSEITRVFIRIWILEGVRGNGRVYKVN